MFISKISDNAYDVAIVGTGPAGISLAYKLAEQTNANILLIESGKLEIKPEIHKLSDVDSTGDLPKEYYPPHAQRVFGGTSTVWNGFCSTLEKRSFLNNEWPIRYEEIASYYKDAADILELPPEAYETPTKQLVEGGNVIYRPYYLSPPVRFNQKYHTQLSDHQQIKVLLNSTCTKIIANGNFVETLLVQDSEGNSTDTRSIKAKHYVLACGGIGNPRLLQLSGLTLESPVGNHFMEHPHIYNTGVIELSQKIVPILGDGKIVHALQLSDEYCLKENLRSFTVSFEIDSFENRAFLGEMHKVYISQTSIRSEMVPDVENQVFPGDGLDRLKQPKTAIKFKFNYQELAKKTWDAFARELLASGIGRAATPPDFYKNITGGGHYIGTTRMGTSANNSVVDANCQVHNIDNLFIAGSSVFPASAAANPTFSIVALALRLADHLSTKLQG